MFEERALICGTFALICDRRTDGLEVPSFCTNPPSGFVRKVGEFPVQFGGTKRMIPADRHLACGGSCWHGWRLGACLYEHRQCFWFLPTRSCDVVSPQRGA